MFEPEDGQSELVELGDFATAERAAAAHDIAAIKYIGHLAPRNFTHDFEQVSAAPAPCQSVHRLKVCCMRGLAHNQAACALAESQGNGS